MNFGQPVTEVATITADGEVLGKVGRIPRTSTWLAVSVHRPDHVHALSSRVDAAAWLYAEASEVAVAS